MAAVDEAERHMLRQSPEPGWALRESSKGIEADYFADEVTHQGTSEQARDTVSRDSPLERVREALLLAANASAETMKPVSYEEVELAARDALAAVAEAERREEDLTKTANERIDFLEAESAAAEDRAAMWEAEYREEQRRTSTAEARAAELERELKRCGDDARAVIKDALTRAAAAEQALEAVKPLWHCASGIEVLPAPMEWERLREPLWDALQDAAFAYEKWREALGAQRQEDEE
jgi:hypothetical protein